VSDRDSESPDDASRAPEVMTHLPAGTTLTGRRVLSPIRDKSWGLHGQFTRELVGLLVFIGLILDVYVFGFYVGIPAFMIVYALAATRRVYPTWPRRLMFGVISGAVMWAVTFEMINLLHLQFQPLVLLY
jgi:hypothetical protein